MTSALLRRLWLLLTLGVAAVAHAQETELDSLDLQADSVSLDEQRVVGVNRPGDLAPPDTVVIDMVAEDHLPRKAALYSAVLPGLGQIYNKKYWKVPIVYGGFAILGYLIVFNNDRYQLYRRESIARRNNQDGPLTGSRADIFDANGLINQVDQFRQRRDQTVIYTAAWYALNIMDAIVDAHLIEFDVNPDLSFKLEPTAGPRLAYGNLSPALPYTGLALTLHIK